MSKVEELSTVSETDSAQDSLDLPPVEHESSCRNRVAIVIIALSLGFQTFPNLSMSYFFKDVL